MSRKSRLKAQAEKVNKNPKRQKYKLMKEQSLLGEKEKKAYYTLLNELKEIFPEEELSRFHLEKDQEPARIDYNNIRNFYQIRVNGRHINNRVS